MPGSPPPADPRLSAALLSAWGAAVLDGRTSPDQAASAVAAHGPGPRVEGLPGEEAPVSLPYALAGLRRLGVRTLRLVLPVPGDVAGLPGPPALNAAAVAAGAAVLADRRADAPLAFLPAPPSHADQAIVARPSADSPRADQAIVARPRVWVVQTAGSAGAGALPALADAERELAEAMREVTEELAKLDVARMPPYAEDALRALRAGPHLPLPPGHPARAVRLALGATRLLGLLELARLDDGAAISAGQMRQRGELLGQVSRAARRALCAAASGQQHDPARPLG